MSKKIIVITGASSGFGRLTAEALAKAGHTVYASMRDTTGRNAPQVVAVEKFARDNNVDLRPIELDVSSESSIESAIQQIVAELVARLDVNNEPVALRRQGRAFDDNAVGVRQLEVRQRHRLHGCGSQRQKKDRRQGYGNRTHKLFLIPHFTPLME